MNYQLHDCIEHCMCSSTKCASAMEIVLSSVHKNKSSSKYTDADWTSVSVILCEYHQRKAFDIAFRHCTDIRSYYFRPLYQGHTVLPKLIACFSKAQKHWLVNEYEFFPKLDTFLNNLIIQTYMQLHLTNNNNTWRIIGKYYYVTLYFIVSLIHAFTKNRHISVCEYGTVPTHDTKWNSWNKSLQNSGILKDLIDVLSNRVDIDTDLYSKCIMFCSNRSPDCFLTWFADINNKDMLKYLLLETNIVESVFQSMSDINALLQFAHTSKKSPDKYLGSLMKISNGVLTCAHINEEMDLKNVMLSFEKHAKSDNYKTVIESFLHNLVLYHFRFADHSHKYIKLFPIPTYTKISIKETNKLTDALFMKQTFDENDQIGDYCKIYLATPQSREWMVSNVLLTPSLMHKYKLNECLDYIKNVNAIELIKYCQVFAYHIVKMIGLLINHGLHEIAYGIDGFGNDIGYYGVIPLLLSHIYHCIDYDCNMNDSNMDSICNNKWRSHDIDVANGDRSIVRFIRVSIMKFAKNINRDTVYQVCKRDGPFWEAFALIMGGKYSFYYIDSSLFQLDTLKKFVKLRKYIEKFVVSPISQGLNKLIAVSKLKQCKLMFEFWDEIFGILRLCSCICGDVSGFETYRSSSHSLLKDIGVHQIQHLKQSRNVEISVLRAMYHIHDDDNEKKNALVASMENIWSDVMLLRNRFIKYKFGRICEFENQIESKSRLIHLDKQFNQWKEQVAKKKDTRLLLKWKNVTCIKFCNYCKQNNKKLKKCKGCAKVYYCSKLCQKKDWKQGEHSLCCTVLVK